VTVSECPHCEIYRNIQFYSSKTREDDLYLARGRRKCVLDGSSSRPLKVGEQVRRFVVGRFSSNPDLASLDESRSFRETYRTPFEIAFPAALPRNVRRGASYACERAFALILIFTRPARIQRFCAAEWPRDAGGSNRRGKYRRRNRGTSVRTGKSEKRRKMERRKAERKRPARGASVYREFALLSKSNYAKEESSSELANFTFTISDIAPASLLEP